MSRSLFTLVSCLLTIGAFAQTSSTGHLAGRTPESGAHTETSSGFDSPGISLVASVWINGSFVSPQSVYADSERIYLCSFQGDLFVLERDRKAHFALIQTISIGAPLASVRGDQDNLYVSSSNGSLYVFSKTRPLQFLRSSPLSNYGISAIEVIGKKVYVAKGQAAMTASEGRLYLSELNPGDFALEVGSMRSYGEKQFVAGTTQVFDRKTTQPTNALLNPNRKHANISAWGSFVYMTNPGCCSSGVYIYNSSTLEPVQYLNQRENVIAGTQRMGVPLRVGGSEYGQVDLFSIGAKGHQLEDSVDLRAVTGFRGLEDIEIRALWVDEVDNLVFAASSWGNDASRRGGDLPAFFVLELRLPLAPNSASWKLPADTVRF